MNDKINFTNVERIDSKNFRAIVLLLVGILVVGGLAFLLTFMVTVEGEEQLLVPDVIGKELSESLIILQEKELFPRISMRFTNDPNSQGLILEQKPEAGTVVKAGRRIELIVSRGASVDRIGNYIGEDINKVKLDLQALFASSRQLITIEEPPIYVFDKSNPGTIIEQTPLPDTEINGVTPVRLVVSKGPEAERIKVPAIAGLSLDKAVKEIENSKIGFSFTMRPALEHEKPGTVVSQNPGAGAFIEKKSVVELVYTTPETLKGISAGLFTMPLPENPYPLLTTLTLEPPTGPKVTLISVEHMGKEFSLPYVVPYGSELVLQVLNRVIARIEVKQDISQIAE